MLELALRWCMLVPGAKMFSEREREREREVCVFCVAYSNHIGFPKIGYIRPILEEKLKRHPRLAYLPMP